MKEKLYEYKVIKMQGARHHLIQFQGENVWRLHRWDGPAIEPISKDCELKKGYYLNGIPYDEENYNTLMREREGLPWYKNPSMKNNISDYRN